VVGYFIIIIIVQGARAERKKKLIFVIFSTFLEIKLLGSWFGLA
jgi:hypothetical protein